MISRYKRMARTFEELHIGDLVPMDEALGLAPDDAPGDEGGDVCPLIAHGHGAGKEKTPGIFNDSEGFYAASPRGFEPRSPA